MGGVVVVEVEFMVEVEMEGCIVVEVVVLLRR